MKLPDIDPLSLKWKTAIRENKDILPLWVADMDFSCPEELTSALVKRAENGIYGYTIADTTSYESFISWTEKQHGWKINKKWIRFTPGVVPALHYAIQAFSQPGNSVIVQTPVYYPFFSAIESNDRQIIRNPLVLKDGVYTMDFDKLRKQMHGHTRLMLLCSPHNPSGRVWKAEELRNLAEFCHEFGIIILSDEIHCDLVFDGHKHIPIALAVPELLKHLAVFYAPSKTFNCAGLQIGATVIANNRLRELFDDVLKENGYHMTNCFSLCGFEAAYNKGGPWLKETMHKLDSNKKMIIDFFRTHFSAISVIEPQAGYLLWLDCHKTGMKSDEICTKLAVDGGVELSSGSKFDGEGFIRINFACPENILVEALDRIKKILKS